MIDRANTPRDPDFKMRLSARPGGERLLRCVLCGTCTSCCPVSELDPSYSPRRMMRLILAGYGEELLLDDALWRCNQCHACVAHCPQDVRFADVLRALREMAVEDGLRPQGLAAEVQRLDEAARRQRLDAINSLLAEGAKR